MVSHNMTEDKELRSLLRAGAALLPAETHALPARPAADWLSLLLQGSFLVWEFSCASVREAEFGRQ